VSWRSKASWFSGRWRSSRGVIGTRALVGPSRRNGYPPVTEGAPMTADVRRTPRRGTTSRMRPSVCTDASTRDRACARQTRPSLGPSTRARQSSLHTRRQKRRRGGATAPASRLGKSAQAGGTSTGVGRADAARLAACHRFRKGEGVTCREKDGGRGLPPCEDQELRLVCSHVVFSCRSLQVASGPE